MDPNPNFVCEMCKKKEKKKKEKEESKRLEP